MKPYRLISLLFLSFFLIFSMPILDNASSMYPVGYMDFDDIYVNGDQVAEDWMTTWSADSSDLLGVIDSGESHSELYSYKMKGSNTGCINFTDTDFDSLRFFFHTEHADSSWKTVTFAFMDDTYNIIFKLELYVDDTDGFYANIATAVNTYPITIANALEAKPLFFNYWCSLTISRTTLNTVNISFYDRNGTFYNGATSGMDNDWDSWTGTINYTCNSISNWIYLDDLSYNGVTDEGGSSDTQSDPDWSYYCSDALIHTAYNYDITNAYIEQRYNSKITGTIHTVDLYLSPVQHLGITLHPTFLQMSAYDNDYGRGKDFGYPDSIIPVSDGAIARWSDMNLTLVDEFPVFEFYGETWGTVDFWDNERLIRTILLDRRYSALEHDNPNFYGDGYFSAEVGTPLDDDPNVMLDMCFYFDRQPSLVDPYSAWGYTLSTGEPLYTTCSQVSVHFYSPLTPVKLLLYKDNVQYNLSGQFPDYFTANTSTKLFRVIESGSYEVKLFVSNIEMKSCYFNVTGTTCNNMIDTKNNPSFLGMPFEVLYRYNGTTDGAIYYNTVDDIDTAEPLTFFSHDDGGLVTGSASLTLYDIGTYYFYLAKNLSGNYVRMKTHIHYVDSGSTIANLDIYTTFGDGSTKSVDGWGIDFQAIKDVFVTTTIEYHHPFINGNVWILVNGQKDRYVGGSRIGSYDATDRFLTVQSYNVSLVYYVWDGTTRILDTVLFECIRDPLKPITGEDIFPDISIEFGAIIGTIITVVFLFMPMLISLSFGKTFNLPPIIYILSGGIGIVFSVIMGFFPIWVPFFFVAIGVIITALLYFQSK